jgi:ABC-type uncharacterized transport system permease subunit
MGLNDTILLLAVIAYAIAGTAYYLAVARRAMTPESLRIASVAMLAGALLHLLSIVNGSVRAHTCPVTSVQFAVSLTGLVTVGIFLTLASRVRIEPLGAMVAPLGLVALISSQFMHRGNVAPEPPKLWLAIHITSNVVGVGLFVLSAGVGAAYLIQASRLKRKRAEAGERHYLPGLLPLEKLMRRLLLIGFVPLSLGVTTGAAFANRLRFGSVDALRIGLSYGVWLLAGLMIVVGPLAGWRGRKIAWGNITGALVSLLVVLLYVFTSAFTGVR